LGEAVRALHVAAGEEALRAFVGALVEEDAAPVRLGVVREGGEAHAALDGQARRRDDF
jgi:hypothetical protein